VDSAEEPWYNHGTVTIPSPSLGGRGCLQHPPGTGVSFSRSLPITGRRFSTPIRAIRPPIRWSGGEDARVWQSGKDRVHRISLSALRQGKHLVAMSCKSSLCLRCAKVHVDTWVSQVSQVLHEGVIYRHIILTVPALFRPTSTSTRRSC